MMYFGHIHAPPTLPRPIPIPYPPNTVSSSFKTHQGLFVLLIILMSVWPFTGSWRSDQEPHPTTDSLSWQLSTTNSSRVADGTLRPPPLSMQTKSTTYSSIIFLRTSYMHAIYFDNITPYILQLLDCSPPPVLLPNACAPICEKIQSAESISAAPFHTGAWLPLDHRQSTPKENWLPLL